jgi:hypothetical protein
MFPAAITATFFLVLRFQMIGFNLPLCKFSTVNASDHCCNANSRLSLLNQEHSLQNNTVWLMVGPQVLGINFTAGWNLSIEIEWSPLCLKDWNPIILEVLIGFRDYWILFFLHKRSKRKQYGDHIITDECKLQTYSECLNTAICKATDGWRYTRRNWSGRNVVFFT